MQPAVICLVTIAFDNVISYAFPIHLDFHFDAEQANKNYLFLRYSKLRLKMPRSNHGVLVALLIFVPLCSCDTAVCDIPNKNERFDCHPDINPTSSNCQSRGCCWQSGAPSKEQSESDVGRMIDVPYCFYPKDYPTYNVTAWKETDYGYTASLARSKSSSWPNDVKTLTLDIWLETAQRLHFKIYDPNTKRYEVPIRTPPVPRQKARNPEYVVKYRESPFGISVTRRTNGAILFDTMIDSAPLIFADQFIQISSQLSTHLLYGIGGRKSTLLHNASSWQQFAMWARDQPPQFNTNLYGSHPFYINIEPDGLSHGVFLLNSNAMDVDIQPMPAVTFRTIGGILDFYVFTGPSTTSVVQQYTEVIGRPQMPPYWALGFHLCRYNYGSVQKLKQVIERNRKLKIPYEVQWNDIDYMDKHLDWTYDKVAYAGLPDVVKDIHNYGQKYVIIVDPGISTEYPGKYKPYDEGLKSGIFVLNTTGQPLIGRVWPGSTVFPDFTHPGAADWWYQQMKDFHDVLPFDGLWTDMNEPSNFVDGSTAGCTPSRLDRPPYVPGIAEGLLQAKTVCPSARQYLSSHYNLHNMYGLTEVQATQSGLHKLLGKRSLIVSRSSFPSLGHFGSHWSGDISSTWEDLYYSIPAILEYQFYGIPMVGADICGFQHDTTEELCVRWMQLGAFYPFMRNHNDDTSRDQDPAVFSASARQIIKAALELRYWLLPYFYTRFHHSHVTGAPVVQPLFSHYPHDKNTFPIDKQFMWGSEMLISPVLDQGQTEVTAYFPADLWYDIYSGMRLTGVGSLVTIKAPLEKINVHVRGGSILPLQSPNVTTTQSRKNPFEILVAFNTSGLAFGSLFWDDGESLDTFESGKYDFIEFNARKGSIISKVVKMGYRPTSGLYLNNVNVYGVSQAPKSATVNGKMAIAHYNPQTQVLQINGFRVDLLNMISIKWQ